MATAAPAPLPPRPSWRGHVEILRLDHWFKNVFVLPGVVAARALDPANGAQHLWGRLVIGLLAIGCVASSYYTVNELLDAPFDRLHPLKRQRAAAAGRVSVGWGWVQCAVLLAAGLALGDWVSRRTLITLVVLWACALAYNLRPVRTKDIPYLDVISESVNNPLRLLVGWYIAGAVLIPPALLLLSYWMLGAYFMGMKRFAEKREIGPAANAYRPSLGRMSEAALLVAVMFYGAAAMLFFGAFIMRYRLELILSFPLVAWVMAQYLAMGLKPHSPVQTPERLWRQPGLMLAVACATAVMVLCLYAQLPWLHRLTEPTITPAAWAGGR